MTEEIRRFPFMGEIEIHLSHEKVFWHPVF